MINKFPKKSSKSSHQENQGSDDFVHGELTRRISTMGDMQKMYDMCKDIAEFRIVYIGEAHAMDDSRPVRYAVDLGIKEHKNIGERCTTADMMMANEHITIPCIIDKMDNKVNAAYNAHPDRIFVVRKDGRLAVAADHGQREFKPALQQTRKWLAEYKKTGKELELPNLDNHTK